MNASLLIHCTQTDPGGVTPRIAAARKASLTAFDVTDGGMVARQRINAAGGEQPYALGVRPLR